MNGLKHFFSNIFTSGTFNQFEIGKRSRIIFLNAVTLTGIIFLYGFSVYELVSELPKMAIATSLSATLIFGIFLATRIFKKFLTSNFIIVTIILGLFSYFIFYGGAGESGFIWAFSFPLIAIFLLGIKIGSLYSLAMWAALFCGFLVPSMSPYTLFETGFAVRVLGTYVFIYLFSITYELVRTATHKRMTQINTSLKSTTSALSSAKIQTDTIMSNVDQGIFLLNKELIFQDEHSNYLTSLFNKTNFGGIHIMDILGPFLDERAALATKDYLDMFFRDDVNPDLLLEINPIEEVHFELPQEEGKRKSVYLKFFFERIFGADGTPMIIGIINDITEEIQLQKILNDEKEAHDQDLEHLFSIINVEPSMMTEFLEDSEEELDYINEQLKNKEKAVQPLLIELFQSIHSIKGNALLLDLKHFSEKAHNLEDSISALMNKQCEWEAILDLIYKINSLHKELDSIRSMREQITHFQTSTKEHSQGSFLEMTIERAVKKQAEIEGKNISIDFSNFDNNLIEENHRKILKNPLIQLARNAVSHGIETSSHRETQKKKSSGTVTFSSVKEGGNLVVCIRDDGAGLQAEKILQAASKSEAFTGKDLSKLPAGKILGLIFHPGFSTRENSNLAAGRGIGMNIIKTRIEKAGGKLKVKTVPGKFTEFSIVIPV